MHPTLRGPVVRCRRAGCAAAHTAARSAKLLAQLGARDPARLERLVDMLSAAIGDCPVPVHGTSACPEKREPKDCPLKRDLAEVRRLLRTADEPGGFPMQPTTVSETGVV